MSKAEIAAKFIGYAQQIMKCMSNADIKAEIQKIQKEIKNIKIGV